jgi:tetratricopeptide (TPR) repeat protein
VTSYWLPITQTRAKVAGSTWKFWKLRSKKTTATPTHYFYYSRELTFYRRWEEAKVALKTYLSMDAASNQNERCYAQRLMAKCYSETGNAAEAEKWLLAACRESPNTREPWCELALLMYQQQSWEECLAMSLRALKITDKTLVYTCDPTVWGHWPHDLAAISAFKIELYRLAVKHGKLAVELSPDDDRLKANLDHYSAALETDSDS